MYRTILVIGSREEIQKTLADGDEENKMKSVSYGANCVISIPSQSKLLKLLVCNVISLR